MSKKTSKKSYNKFVSETVRTKYDLEERTLELARSIRVYCLGKQRVYLMQDDLKQVIRSSGSIGANYIEANDGLSKKDSILRMKIAKKEARETIYWLRLLDAPEDLIEEARQISFILASIINKLSEKERS